MSTLSQQIVAREEAAKKKPAKKKAAKRDENGRFVKKKVITPGEE